MYIVFSYYESWIDSKFRYQSSCFDFLVWTVNSIVFFFVEKQLKFANIREFVEIVLKMCIKHSKVIHVEHRSKLSTFLLFFECFFSIRWLKNVKKCSGVICKPRIEILETEYSLHWDLQTRLFFISVKWDQIAKSHMLRNPSHP